MSQHKEEAQRLLDRLRSGTDRYNSLICYLREEVQEGNFSLDDIGTSEKELEQLRVNGCKAAAHKWLYRLRSGTDPCNLLIGWVREAAKEGNFSLDDIGTSEKELEQLRVNGCKAAT